MMKFGMRRIVLAVVAVIMSTLLIGCECFVCPTKGDGALRKRVATLEEELADMKDRPMPVARGGQLIIRRHGPEQVNKGQEYEYTIDVINNTGGPVQNVGVTEEIPAQLEYLGANPNPVKTGPPVQWTVGEMAADETKTLKVRVRARETGSFQNCAMASHRTPVCAMVNVVEPALALKKMAPEEVLLCDTIPMTVEVENTGTGVAEDVKIEDELPQGLVSADGSRKLTKNIGDLAAGESQSVDFNVKAQKTGTYQNSAVAMGAGDLRAESNTTKTVVRQPVLKIAKEGPGKRFLDQHITYKIMVQNTGDAPAENTRVKDEVPEYTEFVSASQGGTLSGNTVMWNLGTLDPGESQELQMTLRAAGMGTARNTAMAEAVCAEDVSASAETKISGISAILLEVVDIGDPIEVGNTETYVITTTNQGSADAKNVRIVVTMEDEMEYVSADGPTEATVDGRKISFAPLASLAPKDKATWQVKVKAVAAADVRLKVDMTSDMLKRPVEETEATNFYE